MKYKWMAFKARDAGTLEADIDQILDGFGTDYRITFCQELIVWHAELLRIPVPSLSPPIQWRQLFRCPLFA